VKILDKVLDLLFPRKCVFCKKILHRAEIGWCEVCTESLPYTEFGSKFEGDFFDFCIAPLFYKDITRDALLSFKFKNAPIYSDPFGKILAECIIEHPDMKGYDIITWVPLSQKRKRTRGYDQAELLAVATAKQLNNIAVGVLEKTLDVKPQSDFHNAADRRVNIDGAYDIIDSSLVTDKCVLLIDDIITTGSTLSECAKVLLDAGAHRVVCACMCRGE